MFDEAHMKHVLKHRIVYARILVSNERLPDDLSERIRVVLVPTANSLDRKSLLRHYVFRIQLDRTIIEHFVN